MKRIIAIVRPEKMEPLKEALFAARVSGMTIAQVMGCGNQHGWSEYFRGTEVLLNMVPKVKFELVVAEFVVHSVLYCIRQVLLLDIVVRVVVRVQVVLSLYGCTLAVAMHILQVPREVAGIALLHILNCHIYRHIRAV